MKKSAKITIATILVIGVFSISIATAPALLIGASSAIRKSREPFRFHQEMTLSKKMELQCL